MPAPPSPGIVFPSDVEQWRTLVAKYFPPSEVGHALAVMQWESSGDPHAHGDKNLICTSEIILSCFQDGRHYGDSWGLMQVRSLRGRPSVDSLKDPEVNISWSARHWKMVGWKPWTGAHKLGLV